MPLNIIESYWPGSFSDMFTFSKIYILFSAKILCASYNWFFPGSALAVSTPTPIIFDTLAIQEAASAEIPAIVFD